MQGRQSRADVVDELECLRDDRAVERLVRDLGGVGEVADDRRVRVALLRHEDVDACDVGAVARRVVGCRDLEDATADVAGALADEPLDEDAVDRRPSLVPPVRVDRRGATKRAEVGRAASSPVEVQLPARGAGAAARARGRGAAQPVNAAMIVAVGSLPPAAAHRRRVAALRRRRALARRLDRRRWCRPGASVELLTVFGCDPDSTAPPGAGTDGEASRRRASRPAHGARRIAVHAPRSGATPVCARVRERRLRAPRRRGATCATPCRARFDGADLVLLPGSPLTHPDHEWLARTLSVRSTPGRALRRAAVHPAVRSRAGVPDVGRRAVGGHLIFEPVAVGSRDRLAKWRAIRRYRSSCPSSGWTHSPGRPAPPRVPPRVGRLERSLTCVPAPVLASQPRSQGRKGAGYRCRPVDPQRVTRRRCHSPSTLPRSSSPRARLESAALRPWAALAAIAVVAAVGVRGPCAARRHAAPRTPTSFATRSPPVAPSTANG